MKLSLTPKFLGKTASMMGLATLAALGLAAAPAAHAQGFQGPYDPSNFTASGTAGTYGISPTSGPASTVDFTYSYTKAGGGVPQQTYDYKTTAAAAGPVTFTYDFSGYSAFNGAYRFFNVVDYTTNQSVSLVNVHDGGTFDNSGIGALNVNTGDTFGFQIGGGNTDSDSRIYGDLKVTNFNAPGDVTAAPEPSSVAVFAFAGLGLTGLMLKARKRKSSRTA